MAQHREDTLGGFGDLVGACEVIKMVERVYNPLDILDDSKKGQVLHVVLVVDSDYMIKR